MKFGEYITENGIYCSFVAKKIGISSQALHKIKTGKSEPGLKLALKIVEYTKGAVTLEDLIVHHVKKSNDDEKTQEKFIS